MSNFTLSCVVAPPLSNDRFIKHTKHYEQFLKHVYSVAGNDTRPLMEIFKDMRLTWGFIMDKGKLKFDSQEKLTAYLLRFG